MNQCEWDSAYLLIFSENVGPFIYYSHLLPLILSLVLGLFVLINNPKALVNRILFCVTIFFSLWVYFDLILWASPSPELVMFFWSIIVPIELLLYMSALYLVYVFTNSQKDVSLKTKIGFSLFFAPILLFTHTSHNLMGLSPDCDEGAIEGILIQYMYMVEIVIILIAIFLVSKGYRHFIKDGNIQDAKRLLIVGLGTIIFLISFTLGNLTLIFSVNPDWEQYKLFGMPIFVALITYSIVSFRTFDSKLIATQALVVSFWVLVSGILFIQDINIVHVVTLFTLILSIVVGSALMKSVKQEAESKEKITKIALDLEKTNLKLKDLDKLKTEFLSLATHQIRSPLTSISGYSSMLLEGSYGDVAEKQKEPLLRIFQSTKNLTKVVEDFLNVSKIEQGGLVYNLSEVDLGKLISQIVDEMDIISKTKGLSLSFDILCNNNLLKIEGDEQKLRQVFLNFIDNAIKYTNEGSIKVSIDSVLSSEEVKISIKDTGAGIDSSESDALFQKFSRTNSGKLNFGGSGLGLYLAKEIINGHGGEIKFHSEGKDKGTTFIVYLPFTQKNNPNNANDSASVN